MATMFFCVKFNARLLIHTHRHTRFGYVWYLICKNKNHVPFGNGVKLRRKMCDNVWKTFPTNCHIDIRCATISYNLHLEWWFWYFSAINRMRNELQWNETTQINSILLYRKTFDTRDWWQNRWCSFGEFKFAYFPSRGMALLTWHSETLMLS